VVFGADRALYCVSEQAEGAKQADLPAPMASESGGELVVGFDDSRVQYSHVSQSPAKAMAGKFNLQIKRVQRAPVQRLSGLREQLLPEAVGEVLEMLDLRRRCIQTERPVDLRLEAARHGKAKDEEAASSLDLGLRLSYL
jgi:hypothetical protein